MNLRYRDECAVEVRGKVHNTNRSFTFRHMLVQKGFGGRGLTVAQKIWYCVATVGGKCMLARLQSFSAFQRWGNSEQSSLARRAWLLIQRVEGIYKAASLIIYFSFFVQEGIATLASSRFNSSSIKNFLLPFSKDKSSDSSVDDTLCSICQGNPTIPFLAIPCQHSYCYYCLQTRCSAAPSFHCPQCGESIAAMQRHGGSVNNISQIQ